MSSFLVTILTSSRLDLLKNTLESVIEQIEFDNYDIFIIVNTTNELYYHSVIEHYKNHTINKLKKIIRTESNGKPGKGHNSLLHIFKQYPEYEYLVILDGDDKLYPYSIKKINTLYSLDNYDVITLLGNTQMNQILKNTTINNSDNIKNFTITTKINLTYYYVSNISKDYNDIIATPYRLLSINKKVLDHYLKLYDERMFIYDDYMMFLILYMEECFKKNIKILNLSDPYMYLCNKINTHSVSYSGDIKSNLDERIIKKNLFNEILNGKKLQVENINITQYNHINTHIENMNIINQFELKTINEANKYLTNIRNIRIKKL